LELAGIIINNDVLKHIPFMLISSEIKGELFQKAIDLGALWVRNKDELKWRDLPSEVATIVTMSKAST
jgi:hypothetical protein